MTDQEEILAAIKKIGQDVHEKICTINKNMETMETNITVNINKNIDEKFTNLQLEVDELREKTDIQDRKIENFDRQLRRKNILLFGVAEEERSYKELEEIVLHIITETMEIDCTQREIELVKRIGRKSVKPRPILVSVTTMGRKIELLQNKHKLEKTGCYIKEDFTKKVLETRKSLQEALSKELEKGNRAFLKQDKLVILNNKPNKRALSASPKSSEETEDNENENTYKSPSTKQAPKKNKVSTQSPKAQRSVNNFFSSRINNNKQILTPSQNKQGGKSLSPLPSTSKGSPTKRKSTTTTKPMGNYSKQ